MKTEIIQPHELTAGQQSHWLSILRGAKELESPFLHPTYAQVLQQHRSTIEVGVITDGPETIGYFPFERFRQRCGQPAGARLCDLQGVIVMPNRAWQIRNLMQDCGLTSWDFRQVPISQTEFQPYEHNRAWARHLDLSQGYEQYVRERRLAGSSQIRKTKQKRRKLQREMGPLRFEFQSVSRADFQQLIEWKTSQRVRTKTFDVLQFRWVSEVLDQIRSTRETDFEGVFSTLHAGDRLVAAHLGMRTANVLHYWFPSYDRTLARYSPGMVLLLEVARAAAASGVQRIDLGKGNDRWKCSFGSGQVEVASGSVDVSTTRRNCRRLSVQLYNRAQTVFPSRVTPKRMLRSFALKKKMG